MTHNPHPQISTWSVVFFNVVCHGLRNLQNDSIGFIGPLPCPYNPGLPRGAEGGWPRSLGYGLGPCLVGLWCCWLWLSGCVVYVFAFWSCCWNLILHARSATACGNQELTGKTHSPCLMHVMGWSHHQRDREKVSCRDCTCTDADRLEGRIECFFQLCWRCWDYI